MTTASAEMKWLNGWSAAAAFEGEFSGISSFYAGKGDPRAPRHPITQFGLHFLRYAVMRRRLLVMRVMRAHVLMVRRPLVAACGALDWCTARRRRGRDAVGLSFRFRPWERKP
jgi:hypothetical protein